MKVLQVCLLLAVATPAILAAVVPTDDVVSRCMNKEKKEMEKCLVELMNEMKPDFEEGLPDFKLQQMRELMIERFSVADYQNENSYLKLDMWDIIMKGLEETSITNLRLDYDSMTAHWDAEAPELYFQSKYKADAKLSLIPISGEGTMWARMKDVKAKGECKFDLVGDDHHLKMTGKVTEFESKDVTIRLNNLYEDNPILKEAAEAFINDNGQDLLELIKPAMMEKFGYLITNIGSEIGTTLPLTKLAGQEYLKKAFNL